MRLRIAIINEENIVTNMISCTYVPENGIDVTNDKTAAIGKKYQNGSFVDAPMSIEKIQELRRIDYPPLEDLADALFWQSKGDNRKMEEYIQKCEEVKLKYPLPD